MESKRGSVWALRRHLARGVGAGALLWLACGDTVETVEVERSAVGTLQAGDRAGQHEISQRIDNDDIDRGDVDDVFLESLVIDVLAPADADLSFVHQVEVFVEAPGLPAALVARQDEFPAGVQSVELEILRVELTDYVTSREITLRAVFRGDAPPEDVRVVARARIDVGVTWQGVCAAM